MGAETESSGGENGQLGRLGTGALVKEIAARVELLARKQVELAKTELRADLRSEARLAGGLGIAALGALTTLNLLLVTVALALSLAMPAWVGGLIVSGATLAVAAVVGLVGWRQRVRDPLARTRRTLKDDVKWARERLA
ncbi:MAG TPA: phage holin family protein [Polyangia bacterium]|nr:phage holin family protein [Polyangia bacterium]